MSVARKALVIGASGQVGGALLEAIGRTNAIGTYRANPIENGLRFELEQAATDRSLARALVNRTRPGVVYVTAGMTHVDGCEERVEAAMLANRDGPAAVARAAHELGARTVYYSTEYVFDGKNGPYSETDEARPVSVYGRSKLEGERAVLEADPQALVIRTTVVYGPETSGKNFAYRLAARVLAGEAMEVPRDQISSPTYGRDLARASTMLVEKGTTGVVNVAGGEVVDRAAFALRVVRAAGLDAGFIEPVSTEALGQRAARPLRAGLRIDTLRKLLPDFRPRTIKDAVAHWLANQRGKAWPK